MSRWEVDMGHPFHHSAGYPRHDVSVIPQSRRLAVLPHFFFGSLACFGALLDRGSYNETVYDSLFQYIPLEAWSIGFGIVAVIAAMVLLTGTWRTYAATNLLMLFLSCSWTVALAKTKFIDDIKVTPLGFALWLFVVITCLVNAAIPTTVTTVKGTDV